MLRPPSRRRLRALVAGLTLALAAYFCDRGTSCNQGVLRQGWFPLSASFGPLVAVSTR